MRIWLAVAFLLVACLAACHRDTRKTLAQVAVLRFENLSADPANDWMGRAFSEVLSAELAGSTQRYVIQWRSLHSFDRSLGARPAVPGVSAESTAALVAGANGIVYGEFAVVNGSIRATAMEENLVSHRVVRVVSAAGSGVLPVAEALARQLGETHALGTQNAGALHAYADALEASDPATAARDFGAAVSADPEFGRAYLAWIQQALAQRDGTEAGHILDLAGTHRERFQPIDRAGLDLGAAALRGDYKGEIAAIRTLTQLDPANPDHHRTLAEALMRTRDFEGAVVEFRRGLTVRPDDIVALNSMGYAAAYSGDLPTAIRVLRVYELLRPNEPNPLDSLGDVHFALGRFQEAEQFYLAAHNKSANFLNGGELLKAAQARLMTGDVKGATTLANRYLAARQAAHDPNEPYHAAMWSWHTGARKAAADSLDRLAREDASGPLHAVASRADAQAAIWLMALGDRSSAADHARKAVAEADAATAAMATLVASLVQPDAFAVPASLKEYAQAYSALYDKQFQAAAPALEEIYHHATTELDDGVAVLLAWAYQETGQWQRAAPLLRLTPLPQSSGIPMFASLYFPRIFFLRGVVLDHEGHHPDAARNFQVFHLLSGPDGLIWGEEQAAR